MRGTRPRLFHQRKGKETIRGVASRFLKKKKKKKSTSIPSVGKRGRVSYWGEEVSVEVRGTGFDTW